MSAAKRRGVMLVCLSFLLLWPITAAAGEVRLLGTKRFQDQNSRIIQIGQPFGRIICLYGAHAENLFTMGAGKQLCGISAHTDLPDRTGAIPLFSYRDGLEKFLAVKPDLVLVRPMIERAYPQLIQRLEQNSITVVSLQPGDIDQMYTYWRVLGMLAGREPAAENMVARFQQAVAGFRSLSQAVSKKKKVYFEAIHDKMKTFSPGAMPIFALETAGGINVAAEAQAVRGTNIAAFGKERLLSLGMQIDVYLAQVGAMNRTSQEMIRSEPGFEMIKAVRQNRIYLIEEAVVSRPTLRLLEGIYIIGEVLYPDIFSASGRAILSRAGVQTDKQAKGGEY